VSPPPDAGAEHAAIGALLAGTGVGIALFWVAFFTVGLAPADPPPCYLAFEHAFPGPDLVLAAVLIAAGLGLRVHDAPRRRRCRGLALAGAGALVFLGLLDVSFNAQNGMYAISAADTALALAINAWCIGLGAWAVRGLAR
jgi:hypothetical protein